MNIKKSSIALAIITTALSAGLMFAYEVSVNPAFKKLSDTEYIAAMQSINEAIQNVPFGFTFMGAGFFSFWAAYLHRKKIKSLKFRLLVIATILYIFGTLGITFGANIPLNDQLAKIQLQSASVEQISKSRKEFQTSWNNWHTIRTITAISALIFIVMAAVSTEQKNNIS